MPVLLLTTIGRKTGKRHSVPVVFLKDGPHSIIAPGVLARPAWYANLKQSPHAVIQVGDQVYRVATAEAGPEDRSRLWAKAPAYWNDYQKMAERELPMLILRRVDKAQPPQP